MVAERLKGARRRSSEARRELAGRRARSRADREGRGAAGAYSTRESTTRARSVTILLGPPAISKESGVGRCFGFFP